MKLSQQARLLPWRAGCCQSRISAKWSRAPLLPRGSCYFNEETMLLFVYILYDMVAHSQLRKHVFQEGSIWLSTELAAKYRDRAIQAQTYFSSFFFFFFIRKQFHIVKLTKQNEIKSGTLNALPLLLSFELRAINYHYRRTVETEMWGSASGMPSDSIINKIYRNTLT